MLKMADLIKTALNEVGCEELPSGCDDISVDPTFIENSISTTDQQPVFIIQFLRFQQLLDTILHKTVLAFLHIKNHFNSLLSNYYGSVLSMWGNLVMFRCLT